MATLENSENNAKSSRRGISFQFQSKDLPSRRLLGKGLSGVGYETAWKGARYARKDFVGVQRDIFLQEATVLVGLKDHQNIVKTYGWTIDKRSCSLILEYVDEDLVSLLQKRMDSKRGVIGRDLGKQSSSSTSTQPVDLPEAVDMMLQIATGVEYLHEQGFAHGDLKTKNILVTHRKDGDQSSKVLKLSDFGLVGTKRKSRYIVSRKVRKLDMVRWKSPESLKILSRRLHSSNGDEDETSSESESECTPSSVPEVSSAIAGMKSSDVYSFALVCSQILTGHTPYPYLDWKELMVRILSGFRPDLPDSCHPLLRELLISCWGDAAERPSFSAVRMKLKRVQWSLITAMGKRTQEATAPSVAYSPAHQAAVIPSTEVSRSSGNCLLTKPSRGPAIVPSEWTASITSMRINALGVPSAATSALSPPATAAASSAADESNIEIRSLAGIVPSSEPTQAEERLEEALLRDCMGEFDPSVKRFMDRSSDQLVTTSSDLHNDPTTGRGSNLEGTSFLKKFVENEGVPSRICVMLATDVKTGTIDTENAVIPSSASVLTAFKIWQKTRVLSPQRKRENQWLLRHCFATLRGIKTHRAVSQSTVSQGPPLISSCESDIPSDIVKTGTIDTENAVIPSSASVLTAFKIWQKTRVLPPQRKRENQWLLRHCFARLRGIKIHGAVSQSTVSQGPPLISSCESDIPSDIVKTGTMDTVNTVVPSYASHSLEASLKTRALNFSQRNRKKRTNQGLRRSSLQIPTLQRHLQQGIETHGAVSESTVSQEPPVTSCATSMPHRVTVKSPTFHMLERRRTRRQKDIFAGLRRLVPEISKNDKASIANTYLDELEREIHGLEVSKNRVERQYEDLVQRNQQLEASKSQVERQYKDLLRSQQDLEQRNQQLEASTLEVDRKYEDLILSHRDLERRNGSLEERTNEQVVLDFRKKY